MADRPGTRRGRQEHALSENGIGTSARPGTRGKSYLQQPATTSPERPSSRRGSMTQQPQPTVTRSQPAQQGSAQKPAQHMAATAAAMPSASGTGLQPAVPPLQQHPSQVSVSQSDLDGMSSSMSVGAASIDITTADGATQQHHQQQHQQQQYQLPVPSASRAKEQRRQLKPLAAEVWQFEDRGQQPTQQKTTLEPDATPASLHSTATAAAAATTVEHADTLTMSEPSGYSTDFLSFQESDIEIIYSQNSLDRVSVSQQQQQIKQQPKGLEYSSTPKHKTTASAGDVFIANKAAAAQTGGQTAADQTHSKSLVTEDSVPSGDIEFSNSSIALGASGTTAAAAVGGRRVAETNLQVSDNSQLSFESADIDFTTLTEAGNVVASSTVAAAAASNLHMVRSLMPIAQSAAATAAAASHPAVCYQPAAAAASVAVQDAAAATDELFATLTAVPRHFDDSSSSSSDGSDSDDSGNAETKSSRWQFHNRSFDSYTESRHSSLSPGAGKQPTVADVEAAAAAVAETQQFPADIQLLPANARDVLTGLEQLHATLQMVRHRSASSSSSSEDSKESDSITGSSASFSRCSSRPDDRAHVPNAAAAAAAAAEAAAETSVLLSSLRIVQQHDTSPSYSEDFQTLSTEASSLGQQQQNQQQQLNKHLSSKAHQRNTHLIAAQQYNTVTGDTIISEHAAKVTPGLQQRHQQQQEQPSTSRSRMHNNDNSPAGTQQPRQSCSQTTSCDINELLQQQAAAAAGHGCASSKLPAAPSSRSTAKRRSIALQVGSSNDKATQVVFDEHRHLLWDGDNLLQQQRRIGVWDPTATLGGGAATASPAAVCREYVPRAPSQRLPSTLWPVPAGSHALAANHGSCWSVLSATLQQFRAAALLDQLEGLLKTAAQQQQSTPPTVQQQQQQKEPAVAALQKDLQTGSTTATAAGGPIRLPAAASAATGVAAPEIAPSGAGWFSIPQHNGAAPTNAMHSMPLQQDEQQQQQQQTLVSATQQVIVHATADSIMPSAGWMTLPSTGAAAAAGATIPVDSFATRVAVVPAADAAAPSTATLAKPDDGWLSLPLSGTSATVQGSLHPELAQQQQQLLQQQQVDNGFSTPIFDSEGATLAATDSTATISQEAGWFSLPLPGAAAAAAAPKAVDTAAGYTTAETAAPADVWLELRSAPALAEHPGDKSTGQLKPGTTSLALATSDKSVAVTINGAPTSRSSGTSATQPGVFAQVAGVSEGCTPAAGSLHQHHSTSIAAVSSADWTVAAAQEHEADVAAAEGYTDVVSATVGQPSYDKMPGSTILAVRSCESKAQTEVLVEVVPTPLAGSSHISSSSPSRASDAPEVWTSTAPEPSAAGTMGRTPADRSSTHCSESSSGVVLAHEQQLPAQAPQQHQQQSVPSSVDTMLRYLTYLDSLLSQGLAPPGLTLSTARTLRQTLMQTITAAQQQQAIAVVDSSLNRHVCDLSSMQAGGVDALRNFSYEDMISSRCLDSFVSSSLSHIRRKVGRPPVTAAWRSNDTWVAARQVTAVTALGPRGTPGFEPAAQKPDQRKETATSGYQASPGRHHMWVDGQLRQQAKQGHRYTTLEDTLEYIRQHRSRGLAHRVMSSREQLR